MAKLAIKRVTTSFICHIFIQDTTKTDGSGLTGLTNASAGLTCYYMRPGDTGATSSTLSSVTVGTYGGTSTNSGFKEVDSTNMPGVYEFQPANNMLGSGANQVVIMLKGATNMAPVLLEIELNDLNPNDSTLWGSSIVSANVKQIDGSATNGNNATLNLKQLNIVNSAGDAIIASSTGSNGIGINASGNGSGAGIKVTGGGTGNGLTLIGGSTSGDGINITTTSGHGLSIVATGTAKHGITLTGAAASGANAAGHGLTLVGGAASTTGGGTAGNGLNTTGGAGAASTNGAAGAAIFSGGGTNTVASSAHGLSIVGTSTGSGLNANSGAGATGDGITATSSATNGHGLSVLGNGTGNGIKVASTSGDALLTTVSTSGHGVTFAGTGTTKHGINATGGATSSDGIRAVGGGVGHGVNAQSGSGATGNGVTATSSATDGHGLSVLGNGTGNGIKIASTSGDALLTTVSTSGHGATFTGTGTSKHGLIVTGGTGGTSDGLKAVAGSGGVDIRGNITGNVTGTLSTVTTVTNSVTLTNVQGIKKNTALGNFEFKMYDSSGDPKTGLTITSTVSIDGGAYGSTANSATEVSNGLYKIDLAAADLNGTVISLRFTGTGAKDTDVTIITVQP